MPQFSANLGFLWPDDSLADAIRAAKSAGFHAVECHFPYDEPIDAVQQSLEETGFTMLGLNTIRGPLNAGMAALPDSVPEARAAINQAFDYGSQIRALNVHVMAGKITGEKAEKVYLDNLKYASDVAAKNNMSVLIEPLNPFDMPGYFLRDTTHACDLISTLQLTNVKLMFDCYHVGRTEGDVISRFKECFPYIGHIQFASVPDRGPPDRGIVDYDAIFAAIDAGGWNTPLGAEYQVNGPTENTLHWLNNQTGSD